MKILFDHPNPFLLTHGGFQIQIEETKRALETLGISVEYLRWWDEKQHGNIIHFFGRPTAQYVDLAHKRNICVVMSELLTGLGSRLAGAVAIQQVVIRFARNCLPSAFWAKMSWDVYGKADGIIALTSWESELMQRVFDAPVDRIAVIPNGVADEFVAAPESSQTRSKYLVCAATITERKRIVETVRAAIEAQTPLWVVGRPYAETEPYAQRFFALARQYSDLIRYEGAIQARYQLAEAYRQARGFVLLSTQESLSIAALEAAACECPLLLSDLPWARSTFGDAATYCPVVSAERTARYLRNFYEAAPVLKRPPKPQRWSDVAQRLKEVYEHVLRGTPS